MANDHIMKAIAAWFAGISLICGCAFQDHPDGALVLDAVGPSHIQSNGTASGGTLVVYTAPDPQAHFNSSPYHTYYSDYQILSEQGALIRKVTNDSGTVIEGPVEVSLPGGHYRVHARSNGFGWVTVPVAVEPGKVTLVHLDSGETTKRAKL
jgi:hypothetical protein